MDDGDLGEDIYEMDFGEAPTQVSSGPAAIEIWPEFAAAGKEDGAEAAPEAAHQNVARAGPQCCLEIRELPWYVTDQQVTSRVEGVLPVSHVHFLVDEQTGKSTGVVWVLSRDTVTQDHIVALNNNEEQDNVRIRAKKIDEQRYQQLSVQFGYEQSEAESPRDSDSRGRRGRRGRSPAGPRKRHRSREGFTGAWRYSQRKHPSEKRNRSPPRRNRSPHRSNRSPARSRKRSHTSDRPSHPQPYRKNRSNSSGSGDRESRKSSPPRLDKAPKDAKGKVGQDEKNSGARSFSSSSVRSRESPPVKKKETRGRSPEKKRNRSHSRSPTRKDPKAKPKVVVRLNANRKGGGGGGRTAVRVDKGHRGATSKDGRRHSNNSSNRRRGKDTTRK